MFQFNGSPHTHVETPLSGSTIDTFMKRAVKLGRSYFSYTDHNYMSGLYKAYGLATKNKLKFVAGMEIYFKDRNCPIIQTSEAASAKYFKLTLYAPTQEVYQKLSSLSSQNRADKIQLNGEEYGLWNWDDVQKASEIGCLAVSSEVNDIVGKNILLNSPKVALEYFRKLKSMFGERYSLTIVGNKFDKYAVNAINITLEDKSKVWFMSSDYLHTNKAKKIKASELLENPDRHTDLIGGTKNGIYFSYNKKIKDVSLISGNVPIKDGDLQLKINKFFVQLSELDIKLLYSDYAYYAEADDKMVQDVKLFSEDKKEYVQRHMQTSEEAFDYLKNTLGLSDDQIANISNNQSKWLSQFDSFALKYQISLPKPETEETPLERTMRAIKELGRMRWDSPAHVARLKKEIETLHKNGTTDLLPYFFPLLRVYDEYRKHNEMVGAGRGSAAGSLLLYLIGITQIDPIKYDLSFERFINLIRIKMGNYPDVDCDFQSRTLLTGKDKHSGFLYETWGDRASQVSTRTLLRLKSSILDVNRFFNKGKVEPYVQSLSKSLPVAPQGISDLKFVFGYEDEDGVHTDGLIEGNEDFKEYVRRKPQEWEIVQKCLGISRQTSVHASAFIIADRPIRDVVPLFDDKFIQYEAKEVEKAGLIKYDFLVVKQLEDVQLCMELINKKSGKLDIPPYHIWHNDNFLNLHDLPEEEEVFKTVWDGETSTIFQLNTSGMASFTKKLKPKSILEVALILALYRPGPLDFIDPKTGRNMADEYVERRFGRSQPDIPELAELLPETSGVITYQEQVSKVSTELGGMHPDDAEELRRILSKKEKEKALKMKPVFMENAVKKLGLEKAETIWAQMETFSRYGFNKSHAVSYAVLSYQSMYLKYHYPLEWWAAVLSNADEGEISTELFKYVKDLVIAPDINYSGSQMTIDYDKNKIRAKLGVLKGVGEKSIAPIVENRPYKDILDYVKKDPAGPTLTRRLIHVGAMDSLFPASHSLLQKMQDYEDAVMQAKYDKNVETGKKKPVLKKGEIDPTYLTLSPLKDFQLKKAIFPTISSNLTELYLQHGSRKNEGSPESPLISTPRGEMYFLRNGDWMQRLDIMKDIGPKNINFLIVGYVIDCKEFTYSENTKKALKVVIDCDGHIIEKVMWPDYDTGKLGAPKDIKKGSVCLFLMQKRAAKKAMYGKPAKESSPSSIVEIIVESV